VVTDAHMIQLHFGGHWI